MPQLETVSSLYVCAGCGESRWGPIASPLFEYHDAAGLLEVEQWGCLNGCRSNPNREGLATCKECLGTHVVTDPMGLYCVDCKKRPGQPRVRRGPPPRNPPRSKRRPPPRHDPYDPTCD